MTIDHTMFESLAAGAGFDLTSLDSKTQLALLNLVVMVSSYCGDQVHQLARTRKRDGIGESPLEFAVAARQMLTGLFAPEPDSHKPIPGASTKCQGVWYDKSKTSVETLVTISRFDPMFAKLADNWIASDTNYLFIGQRGPGGPLFTLAADTEDEVLTSALQELSEIIDKVALREYQFDAFAQKLKKELVSAWAKLIAQQSASGH